MRRLPTLPSHPGIIGFMLVATALAGCTDDPTPTGIEEPAPGSPRPAFATVGTAPAITYSVVNDGAGHQEDPAISGTRIAYSDLGGLRTYTVRHHDLATGVDAAVPGLDTELDLLPDMSGTRIVFNRVTQAEQAVYLYDVAAGDPPVKLEGGVAMGPAISGNTVAWHKYLDPNDGDGGSQEIFVRDLTAATTTRLTNDNLVDVEVAVSPDENVIVWIKCSTNQDQCDVWKAVRSAGGWTTAAVTGLEGEEHGADTDGEIIAYHSGREGEQDIYWQPVAGGAEQRLALPGIQRNPSISAGLIVFESHDGAHLGDFDIWAYDTETGTTFPLATDPADETLADVSVSSDGQVRVAYTRYNGTDNDVLALSFQRTTAELYDFTGFFQPVDNSPAVNKVRAGSAVPVKFSLGGDQGLDIFAAGYPLTKAGTCDLTASDIIEETVTAGQSSLNYDPVTEQYTYVWKTDKAWAGTCRELVVGLNDGTTHTAWFSFVK